MRKVNCPISKLGDDGQHYFFGYYDKCPWNSTQDRLLAHRATFCDRFPSVNDGVDIGFFDLAGQREFRPLAQTTAWNWQQGSQLQWVEAAGREQVLFNARESEGIRACLLDPDTGSTTGLNASVYTVSSDSQTALTLNYGRLFNQRMDYGLAGVTDPHAADPVPASDGIFRFNFPEGSPELILSIAQIEAVDRNPMGEGRIHWINHLMFNRSGSRFCFLHRFMRNDGIVHSRLMSADADGSKLRLLFEGLVSHYDWLGDDKIFAWAGRRSILAGGSGRRPGVMSLARKCLKPVYYALGKPRISG